MKMLWFLTGAGIMYWLLHSQYKNQTESLVGKTIQLVDKTTGLVQQHVVTAEKQDASGQTVLTTTLAPVTAAAQDISNAFVNMGTPVVSYGN